MRSLSGPGISVSQTIPPSSAVVEELPNIRDLSVFQSRPHDQTRGIGESLDPVQNAEGRIEKKK